MVNGYSFAWKKLEGNLFGWEYQRTKLLSLNKREKSFFFVHDFVLQWDLGKENEWMFCFEHSTINKHKEEKNYWRPIDCYILYRQYIEGRQKRSFLFASLFLLAFIGEANKFCWMNGACLRIINDRIIPFSQDPLKTYFLLPCRSYLMIIIHSI